MQAKQLIRYRKLVTKRLHIKLYSQIKINQHVCRVAKGKKENLIKELQHAIHERHQHNYHLFHYNKLTFS